MKLIVGLGNPGKEYIGTRHNLGYAAVSLLRKAIAPERRWKKSREFNAELSEGVSAGEGVALMRPLTYMNRSGDAVGAYVKAERLLAGDVWVIQDDLDLPFGTMKITENGGTGGHHGVESVAAALETKSFVRFKLGIGRPANSAERYVLEKFGRDERRTAALLVEAAVDAVRYALKDGIAAAMSRFNNKPLQRQSRNTE